MRLFVAVDLSPDQIEVVRAGVAEARIAAPFEYIRWLPESNWHATLAFIGDLPESDLNGIETNIDKSISGRGALEAKPARIQTFPHRNQPRLLALKLWPAEEIQQLVWSLFLALGIRERPRNIRLHVSVARFQQLDEETASALNHAIRDLAEVTDQLWRFKSVTLYESTLQKTGASYRAIRTWNLGA